MLKDKASSTDPEKNVQVEIVPEETDDVVRDAGDIATQVLRIPNTVLALSTETLFRSYIPMMTLLFQL